MFITIEDSLAPGFFVSYSRRQKDLAQEVRAAIGVRARATWFDLDEIAVGDDWRAEIRRGIEACDELVLLVSDDSLASEVVAEEVAIATALGRLIRPLIVAPVSRDLPDDLSWLHHIDLRHLDAAGRAQAVQRLFRGAEFVSAGDPQALKVHACRGVAPPFAARFADPSHRAEAAAIAAALDAIAARYGPASPVWLNSGLWSAAAGDWTAALTRLRGHAAASAGFAGAYFLALHLLERQPAARAPLDRVKEAHAALARAEASGDNPLVHLLGALLEVGGGNAGRAVLDRRMQAFERARAGTREAPSEYVRLYWAMQPSFAALGPYESPIRTLIKGYA